MQDRSFFYRYGCVTGCHYEFDRFKRSTKPWLKKKLSGDNIETKLWVILRNGVEGRKMNKILLFV